MDSGRVCLSSLGLREKLRKREVVFGAWTSLSHPQIAEMFATIMQPDFIGIDIEHSTISQAEAQRIIAAGQACNVPVLPRVASHNGEQIKRLLDSGADGVIVPMVNSRQEAEQIVRWCTYPPVGVRSFGIARAQGYGAKFAEYTGQWNHRAICIVQIESMQGVEAVDEILAVEQVDGVMIGPYDISGSLGLPGQLSHPTVLAACDRVLAACVRHGKACGTQVTEPHEGNVREAVQRGYTSVVLASDIFLLWKWSEQMHGVIQRVRRP